METDNAPIRMIPLSRLYPHPDNPRKDLGDLSELTASIKARGVLQNLTVIPASMVSSVFDKLMEDPDGTDPENAYVVLIGHRRMEAAKAAEQETVPCAVVRIEDPKEQIAIMLCENIQRSSLKPYEEAQGFQLMIDMGGTVEEISERSGFSKSTVRQRLKMAELDPETLRQVSDRQIALSDFDRLGQIRDINVRNQVLESIGTNNFAANVQRELAQQEATKRLPLVKKELKRSRLSAMKESDRYSSKFSYLDRIHVKDWEENQNIPDKAEFYRLDAYGAFASVDFYRKRTRAKSEQKAPEQMAKEQRIRDAWKVLKEASAIAYRLRSGFVAGLSATTKNQTQMLSGAVSLILMSAAYHSPDRDAIYGIFGIDQSYERRTLENLRTAYSRAQSIGDRTVIPRLIYAAFADSDKPAYATSLQSDYPKFNPNPNADALYDWLISLGYEMSDEEKALRDGTHAAFSMAQTDGGV